MTTRSERRDLLLVVVGACFLIVMMDNTILNVALQAIQRDLLANNSQLQWAVDSYILVYASLMFTAGVIADRWGRRRTLAVGLAVFAVASAFSAFADSPDSLILWRAVMGVGGAVVPPTTLAIIKHAVPEEEQGRAMGVWAALGGLSVAFGPILGGALLERFWWGSVFLINVPVAIACLVLLFVVARESRSASRFHLDLPGLLLSTAAIAAVVYGVIRAGEDNDWFAPASAGMIALGIVLAVVLVVVERRTAHPVLDVSLFRSAPFAGGTTAVALAFFALTGGTFLLVFYVQLVLGHTPLQLGLILLPVAVGSVLSAVTSAGVVKRYGFRLTVSLGLALLAVSFGGLLFATATSPLWQLEVSLFVAGLGMGFVMGATTTLAMSAVPTQKAGVGGAVNNTVRQVGAALGVAVLGSVLSMAYRSRAADVLDVLPDPQRERAGDSLGATLLVLSEARPAGGSSGADKLVLVDKAKEAFVGAMHVTLGVGIGVLLFGALIALVWVPSRLAPSPVRDDLLADTALSGETR
ncbi:drug resistance transporter, EmrB/QacA subfamily [Micromonospora rhizosphaerae]|uniref:Drug resistance transporter, EmrB/QacA subfamily n=1 Tax=Micromonospora rhizosphaerae TaxID=568872 RepID=A0A1C6RDM2_9ACTN|nr:MFS transporter [Micromonospora rhizosphaerae]SCL15257.1 drug resistance transporter, EmrB/QacA subfamily [Micromonospora rhizosphaerae]